MIISYSRVTLMSRHRVVKSELAPVHSHLSLGHSGAGAVTRAACGLSLRAEAARSAARSWPRPPAFCTSAGPWQPSPFEFAFMLKSKLWSSACPSPHTQPEFAVRGVKDKPPTVVYFSSHSIIFYCSSTDLPQFSPPFRSCNILWHCCPSNLFHYVEVQGTRTCV